MFSKLFRKGKTKQASHNKTTLSTLDKLNEALEKLERREKVLLKKVAAEVEQAKQFTREKNKRAATQCLIRKRKYEQQVEQIGNFQLRIHDQIIMLESAEATADTVNALRIGAEAMKVMQKSNNPEEVDKMMEEINFQAENMRQVEEALSAGAAADFDEDELEAELEVLEDAEVEDQLCRLSVSAPAGRLPAQPSVQLKQMGGDAEGDEHAAMQAQLAM